MNEEQLFVNISNNIKYYRKRKKLSQHALAKLIGANKNLIAEVEENKHKINILLLYKISIVLDIPISKIMEEAND